MKIHPCVRCGKETSGWICAGCEAVGYNPEGWDKVEGGVIWSPPIC